MRFLLIFKVAMVASIIIGVAYAWQQLKNPDWFPIRAVKVKASYAHTPQNELAEVLTFYVDQGFFGLNPKALTAAIMDTSPWIAQVKLNKAWPSTLSVEIIEQAPVAQWEDKGLVNAEGEIFYPNPSDFPNDLPVFSSNEIQVPALLVTYEKIRAILSSIHVRVLHISLSDRETMTLVLDDGTRIIVGRKDPLPRLQRFVKVYPKIFNSGRPVETVDLRYEHGLSVKWRENNVGSVQESNI